MAAALVSLRDLSVVYRARGAKTTALLGLSLDIRPGEWLAIAGESGSGKSTLAHLVAGTLPREATIPSGEIRHTLRPSAPPAGRRWPGRTAGDVLCVDQDVRHLLDARAPVGVQLEDILCHQNRIGRPQAIRQALDMLEAAGIEPEFYSAAPAALSGGMRRRIALLCAVARKDRKSVV